MLRKTCMVYILYLYNIQYNTITLYIVINNTKCTQFCELLYPYVVCGICAFKQILPQNPNTKTNKTEISHV